MDHPYADGVEPTRLDRDIAATAQHWVKWRRALRRGEGLELDPFELRRPVAGVTTLQAVLALHPSDPLREPLARWVLRLTEQRVNLAARAAIETARRKSVQLIEQPEQGKWSSAELGKKALRHAPLRQAWLSALFATSAELSALEATLWERRAEFARRSKLDLSALERPADDIPARAERFLASSHDAYLSLAIGTPVDFLNAGLALDANADWPGRPTPRALLELAGVLVEHVDLDPGPMPEILAPSSFMRCLARMGAAWAVSSAPRDQPFVIAHDAYGLRRLVYGALFASLPLEAPFAARRLGVARAKAHGFSNAIGRSLLVAARTAALGVLTRHAALDGRAAFTEAFREGAARHLRLELPATATGVWLRPRLDAEQRFVGLLLAAKMRQTLVDTHDDDWFLNPRAKTELSELARLPPKTRAEPDELDGGERALLDRLHDVIGH
jgi:hypothetical protein